MEETAYQIALPSKKHISPCGPGLFQPPNDSTLATKNWLPVQSQGNPTRSLELRGSVTVSTGECDAVTSQRNQLISLLPSKREDTVIG